MILKFSNYILEHKLWGKSIEEFLSWIEDISKYKWCLIDTETTGLRDSPYEVQLTQVSCIVSDYNYLSNSFNDISVFNKKIKLTDTTKELMNTNSRIKNVLSFNHYGSKVDFFDENDTLNDFNTFISDYKDSVFVIQNAEFDMKFLNTRSNLKFKNRVIDTKQILQLFYLPLIKKLSETDNYYKDLVNKIGVSDRDNGLISSSLSKIGPAMGINMSGYHDALTDIKLMQEMFINIIKVLKDNKSVDIKKYQSERINKIK